MGDLGASEIASLVGALGGGALQAFGPSPYQERVSFSGTSADPVAGLASTQDTLRKLIGEGAARMAAPVNIETSVGDLPSFSGGGLPMPIGVNSPRPELSKPFSLKGRDVGDLSVLTGVAPKPNSGGGGSDPEDPGHQKDDVPPRVMGDPPPTHTDDETTIGTESTRAGTATRGLQAILGGSGAAPLGAQGAQATPLAAADPMSGLQIPPGLDPQTAGAIQLLMHAAQPQAKPASTSRIF